MNQPVVDADASGPTSRPESHPASGRRLRLRPRLRALRRRGGGRGLLAAAVVLVVVAAAVVLVGRGAGGDGTGGRDVRTGSRWTELRGRPGAPAPTGRMPVTHAEARAAGTDGDLAWPAACDTQEGTVALPSVYAPPCVPAFSGDNGGATARGVTGDEIRIVHYVPAPEPGLASLLRAWGLEDSAAQQHETFERYVELYAATTELYGRRVAVERFAGRAPAGDVAAARADAAAVVARGPFLVVGGPARDGGTFAGELAGARIPCFACAGALPEALVQELAPYVWTTEPSADQARDALGAWLRAAGERATSTADWAGGALRGRPRRVGVVQLDQAPAGSPAAAASAATDRPVVAGAVVTETYELDPAALPARADELVARLRAARVNTVVFVGDPFMPAYLTEAATRQGWFPEWIFAGSTPADTNTFGRRYDPAQMARASGLTHLPTPTVPDLQEPLRLYRWYYGRDARPSAAHHHLEQLGSAAAWLTAGIHMAGPDLTPESFARGLFRIPPRGGGPTTPRVSYGHWGLHDQMDYGGVDDAAEIWWDPDVRTEDERGRSGRGAWRRSRGGARFTPGAVPTPRRFTEAGTTATVLDELPFEDRVLGYPAPPGAPVRRA